jgi:hypothetical protein
LLKQRATKCEIVVIVPIYITASECSDGAAIADRYLQSSSINTGQSNTTYAVAYNNGR